MKIIRKENYVSPVVKTVSVRMESAMLLNSSTIEQGFEDPDVPQGINGGSGGF